MVDPTTVNTSLAVPIRGTDAGTWDVPVNGNFTLIDSMFGGVTSIALTSAAVTLASSQGQSSIIRLTGTLTFNVNITLPSIYKFWTIDNQLTNSPSSFTASLISTSGGVSLGLPPGTQDIFYDGTTVKFRNLGMLGGYWDYAASAVPTWVNACTNKPYLNCDGTAVSSATYPQLFNLIGATLPDLRGVAKYTLNQGTSRITSTYGLDGNTLFASKTTQSVTLGTSNLPAYTPSGTVSISTTYQAFNSGTGGAVPFNPSGGAAVYPATLFSSIGGTTFTGNAQGGTSVPFSGIGTGTVAGITMIRTGL